MSDNTYKPPSILDRNWKYTPALHTDISQRPEWIRMQRQIAERRAKVTPIKRKAG